jgi:hypothetical protein
MHVAVIGAGLSGLACAHRLREAGAAVRVFDKARGPGGRLATRRTAQWQADIGAQYFTAREPDFLEAVQGWARAGVVAEWHVSLAWLERGAARPVADGEVRWVGIPRMSAITRHLADAMDVEPGQRIEALGGTGSGWRLHGDGGDTHGPFDAVAVALPAPQAAALLEPANPALAREVAAVPMQGCWAAVLTVDATAMPFDGAFVVDHPLRWIAHDGGKPGRDGSSTWVAHAAPGWSDARIEQTAEATLPELVAQFEDATAAPGSAHGLLAHKWRYSQSTRSRDAGCLFDAEQGIGACGDWCNGNRVEGAWTSGRRLAARILEAAGGA